MSLSVEKKVQVFTAWQKSGKTAAFFYIDSHHGIVFESQVCVKVHDVPMYDGFIDGNGDIFSTDEVIEDQIDFLFETAMSA